MCPLEKRTIIVVRDAQWNIVSSRWSVLTPTIWGNSTKTRLVMNLNADGNLTGETIYTYQLAKLFQNRREVPKSEHIGTLAYEKIWNMEYEYGKQFDC